tara:strand:- start:2530 stop:3951 length:1422 start_codon:yes stop_codon:yes gene_type:complete
VLERKLRNARHRYARLAGKAIIGLFLVIISSIFILENLPYYKFSELNDIPAQEIKIKEPLNLSIGSIRKEFKELLQEYNDALKPRLQEANLKNWDPETLFEINKLNKDMMHSFSNSDYLDALKGIKLLKNKTLEVLYESERIYKENIKKATLFFSDDYYDEAELHINRALIISPKSIEAQLLQNDIEKLKQILPLLSKARVARIENNLLKEHKFLDLVLKINPNRPVEAERIKLLQKLIRNNNFDNHISIGFSKIENHEFKEAKNHYQKAKEIYPDRMELKVFLRKLLEEEKSYRIDLAFKQAEQAIREDEWEQVRSNYSEIIKDMPNNEMAIVGLKRANEIIEINLVISQYLESSSRLSDSSILSQAKNVIKRAEYFSRYSAEIKRKIKKLNNLIILFNRLIPVTVMSDSMTYIKVRGIGKLGRISHKIIHLKPGNYIFEGVREGFKSKLLEILIPYDQNNYSVNIICDESI